MSYRRRVNRKLANKEKAYEIERLMKDKRSEEYEALEEVFDRSTLMIIYDFMNKGTIDEIHGTISAGKESRVYWAKDQEGKELAVKIYLTLSAEFKKGMMQYIEGDPRFKGIKRDTRSLIFTWARKEFRNLMQARRAKVRVPKPIAVRDNVLIMNFIGKDGNRAPLLKEQEPENPDRTYKSLVENVRRLYRNAELVHGDLSEYNVMIWKGQPVMFDVSQAVSLAHPMARQFLHRDMVNLNRFFSKLGVKVNSIEELCTKVTDHGQT